MIKTYFLARRVADFFATAFLTTVFFAGAFLAGDFLTAVF